MRSVLSNQRHLDRCVAETRAGEALRALQGTRNPGWAGTTPARVGRTSMSRMAGWQGVGSRKTAFYLLPDQRLVESDHEPADWLKRYNSVDQLRFAMMCPDG